MVRAVRFLNLRRIRRQPLRAVIATIAVAAGVSLAVSIVVLMTSLSRSVEDFGQRVSGPAPLRIIGATARGGIPESVVSSVESVAGVSRVMPLVQAVTLVEGEAQGAMPVMALGMDCRAAHLLGDFPCDPQAVAAATEATPPLTSPSLLRQLGADPAVRTNLGRAPLSGAAAVGALDQLNSGRVLVYSLPVAQHVFSRHGTLDVIYVDVEEGADVAEVQNGLEEELGDWLGVLGATDAPPQAGVVLTIFVPLFTLMALFALGIGAVLVYNTVALSIEERRRQIAVVAALGGTARVVVGGTAVEGAALGLLGGLLGTAGGFVVARPLTASLSRFTERTVGIPIEIHVVGIAVVMGTLLGIAVGTVAAFFPARRAMRMDVAAELSNRELRDETSTRSSVRKALFWAATVAVGLALCYLAQRNGALQPWEATVGPLAFVATTLFLMLAVDAFAPLVAETATPLVRRSAADVRLGIANLVRDPGRTGVMAVAVGAAVGVAFATGSFNRSVHQAISDDILSREHDEFVAVATVDVQAADSVDAAIPPHVIEGLRSLPEVDRVDRSAVVVTGHRPNQIVGVRGFENPWLSDAMILGTKDRSRLVAGEVVIGPALARDRGLRPGDAVRLETPNGYVSFPIQGIAQTGDFGGNTVTMAYEVIERTFGPQPPGTVSVVPRRGVSAAELAEVIRGAQLDDGLRIQTPEELTEEVAGELEQQLAPFWALQRGLLVVAFIAVLSTLLLVGVQRRRELGLLGAVGMTPAQLARMVVGEALAVGIIGIVLGTIAAVLMYVGLLLITPIIVGYRDPFVLDFGTLAIYSVITMAVVFLAAAWPAWRTSRTEVLEAIAYE